MNYVTDRGEFSSLQILRAAYLEAPDWKQFWIDARTVTEQPWGKLLLHASDVGGCPRATMYRLLDTPEKPRGASSKANRAVMFWAGYHFHYLTYSALSWAGILACHEEPVEMDEGWSGTLDAEILVGDERILFDEKTVMPNALNYGFSLPKEKDCLQLATYGLTRSNVNGLIEYCDRAGSNTPKECRVDLGQYSAAVGSHMSLLEDCRSALPELPPVLEQAYVPHYARDGENMVLKTVAVETPWNCGYCDYHLTQEERRMNPATGRMKSYSWTQAESTCKPRNAPPLVVAELIGGVLKSCKSGHEAEVEKLTSTTPLSYYAPQEEDTP